MEGESGGAKKSNGFLINTKIQGGTETQQNTPLCIITSTEMNCMIKFRRVNVSHSVCG